MCVCVCVMCIHGCEGVGTLFNGCLFINYVCVWGGGEANVCVFLFNCVWVDVCVCACICEHGVVCV